MDEQLEIGHEGDTVEQLHRHLVKYGYLQSEGLPLFGIPIESAVPPPDNSRVFDENTALAVELFQEFHGLNVTGRLDRQTAELIGRPRCGVPDLIPSFVIGGHKWETNELTFSLDFTDYTTDISTGEVRGAVVSAFSLWSSQCPLSFREVRVGDGEHIRVRFAAGPHGDGHAFDGRASIGGSTLAHAFYPPPGSFSGQVHLDDDEQWTIDVPVPASAFDILQVAAHEIGHALGLKHSQNHDALMWPYYHTPTKRRLHADDIDGIRTIYDGHPHAVPDRFRAVSAWANASGYAGAFPDFEEARGEDGLLRYGVIHLNNDSGARDIVSSTELGVTPETTGAAALIRSTCSWAQAQGYAGAFPDFQWHPAGDGVWKYGVIHINEGFGARDIVSSTDLGVTPGTTDAATLVRSTCSWARAQGYAGAFPDFQWYPAGGGVWKYGVIHVNKESGARDIVLAADL